MRNGTITLVAVLLAGLVALLALGLTQGSALVYTLGVAPQGPVATLKPGDRACQGAIDLPSGESFERVGFYPRTATGSDSPLDVTITAAAGGRALAHAQLASGFRNSSPPGLRRVDVGRLTPDERIVVCFRNAGARQVELWGTGAVASPSTSATLDGKPTAFDLGVTFENRQSRSLIALAPKIARRASLFHPQWTSPGAYAVLAALVLLAVPALMVLALRRAATADEARRGD